MLHLLCVPAGCSASELFFKKALQQEYEHSLLVTSSKISVQKARVQGVNAVNFDYLANAVLRQCGRFRVRRLSRKAQELVIREVLDGLLQKGQLSYFGRLVEKKGFIQSITSLMDQIGSCGATPEEVRTAFTHWDGRSGAWQQKDRETAAIYGEYLNYLIDHDVFDVAGLYRLAAEELEELLKKGRSLQWDTLYFMGFYQFDVVQLAIIRLLSRICDVWIALPYEAGRPDLYGAGEYTYGALMQYAEQEPFSSAAEPVRAASLQHLVDSLRKPGVTPVPADTAIAIWQAEDRMGEIRMVLRDIKEQLRSRPLKPSEIAVVVRRMEDYSGIRALTDAYGIPAQIPGSASLAANPVFRYLSVLLSTVPLHGREKAEGWLDFLLQPLQEMALGLRTDTVMQLTQDHYYTDYQQLLADVLQKTDCGALRQLCKAVESIPREGTVQAYCADVQEILSTLELKLKAGLLYKAGQITLAGFKNIACAQDAVTALLQGLPQDYLLCGQENATLSCARFLETLTEAVSKVSFTLQPDNQEGIAVLPAVNLEDASFKQVYVLGLREQEFPYFKNENWIYNDRERVDLAALGIALPTAADGYREDIHFFANACAAARERLVLSFFTDEEQNASPYIGEVQKLFTNLQIQVEQTEQGRDESLSRSELELALARTGQTELLQQLEPGLAEAADSDRKRTANIAGWNGELTDPGLAGQAERQIGNRFSASKLEAYRGCPFKFLVSYVWQQQSGEEMAEDVDPARRGSLLHTVLERFVHQHLGEQLKADQWDALRDELDRIFANTWQEFAARGQLYAGDFWEHDKESLRVLLIRWLRSEIAYSEAGEFRPLLTEREFGRRETEQLPLDIAGRRIFLNGKIDRIDKAGNTYYITDYKSGRIPSKAAFLDTDLQLPLYILAADRLLRERGKGTVIGGGYYGLKDGERKESFLFASAQDTQLPWKTYSDIKDANGRKTAIGDISVLQAKMEEVLADMLQNMRNGSFKPLPSGDCETYCPAAKICRYRILQSDQDGEEGHE